MKYDPKDHTYECDGAKYLAQGYPDFERTLYCHYAYVDGKKVSVDYRPTKIMPRHIFRAWLKAGMPPRRGLGPLTDRQILYMAENPAPIEYEPVPWKKGGRPTELNIPEDWKPQHVER